MLACHYHTNPPASAPRFEKTPIVHSLGFPGTGSARGSTHETRLIASHPNGHFSDHGHRRFSRAWSLPFILRHLVCPPDVRVAPHLVIWALLADVLAVPYLTIYPSATSA